MVAMKPHGLALLLSGTLLIAFTVASLGCRSGDDDVRAAERDAAEEAERRPSLREGLAGARDAARGMRDALEGMSGENGVVTETVDFRRLRDLLPERAAGLSRTDASGERQSFGGVSVSTARAEYREDDRTLTVQIMDAAGTGAFALMGAAWLMAEFDRETSDGYERTTTFEGHRAFEKLDERTGRAELQVVVENRFLVSIEGRNVSMSDVQRAARDIDLRSLARMRDEGRQG